mmetsp:Transcript_9545/g.12776  ORF Transcript_9545/g.12776 Transcript_9545/m.12776 type:complete len:86 (+) Transcript_9545:773-1030(+)
MVEEGLNKVSAPMESNVAENSSVAMQQDANDGNHQINRTNAQTNGVSKSSNNQPNPWSYLWLPSRKLREFDFGDWDSYEVVGANL